MAEGNQQQQAGGVPGFPPEGQFFTLTDFGSLNTKSPRMSIDDNEFAWIENFFPIGKGNLRTLPGAGAAKYTAVGGRTIVCMFYYNIGTTPYGLVILDNGTAIQFNTSTGATTTITATPSTFYNGGSLPGFAQYGSSGILIVASVTSNGYYAWDGTTLTSPGGTAPTWLSGLAAPLVYTGNTHTSITVDTMSSTVGLQVGMTVTGSGVQANTTIASIVSSTSITLSLATTTSVTTDSLTFNWPMPSGLSGTSIEVFQNRVWVANNATVTFSAASNGANFATANGGGSFSSNDSFLRQSYNALKQANGYLYIFGDSSINYIGNVQTTVNGSTVTTSFNNLNTDPQVGTPWEYSVVPFGRALMLANTSGVYAMFGGSAEKVSDKLNGLFSSATLPLTGITNMPCGAVATVYGIRVFFLLVTAVDPFTNLSRPMMVAWDGNKWYIASQEFTPTFISTQEVNSQLTAWGTDGVNVYPMFQKASTTLTKKFRGKLWAGKSYLITKQELRVYFEGFDNSGSGFTLNVGIDNEFGTGQPFGVVGGGAITFVNSLSQAISFQATGGGIVFTVPGIGIQGANIDSVYGKLLGFSGISTSPDFTLVEGSILYRDYSFYG